MKHFFEQSTALSPAEKAQLLETARLELKQSPMNFNEMSTQQLLLCFNASAANQYIPRGMESLITTQMIPIKQNLDETITSEVNRILFESPQSVLGYVFENLQVKDIHNYLDLVFRLKTNFQFEPMFVLHFSYDEIVHYLEDFLKSAIIDNTNRKVEVFDDQQSQPWKTIIKASDLEKVDRSIKDPAVIDRPFFSDIHFKITKQGQAKVIKSAFGQLASVQPYFNKSRAPTGELIRSKNKMFLKWKDIAKLKLGTTQAKSFLGVIVNGEFIASSKLITHDIALNLIDPGDIDAFRIKMKKRTVDITRDEISQIEINLDTQQMTLNRRITEDEYHIGRFRKLRLSKGDESVLIHKIIPFNRGESNFEQIQTYFGTRYTECEKARSILNARGEFDLLAKRNVAAGDLVSHLVLSSMKLLGFLPLDVQCIGFKPEDVKNLDVIKQDAANWISSIKKTLSDIIDVSKTPSFTEHNFSRRSKAIRALIDSESSTAITPDHLEDVLAELEDLIQYMDDFFKLNIYSQLEDDLECETATGLDDEEPQTSEADLSVVKNTRLDEDSKSFIVENYAFFEKRDQIENALIRIEKLLFYHKNVKTYAEDASYEPDLIIYQDSESQLKNYQLASFPALPLSKVLENQTLKFADEDEELHFIRFLREFTQKTHQKALELNKTFHHQFKHTLAELTYIADEKKQQLQDELTFLEKPENREAAYQKLLERITALYHQHLKEKEENIQTLETEYTDVKSKYDQYKASLETLLEETFSDEELYTVTARMPERLETMKQEILDQHKPRIKEISVVFNAYLKLYHSAINYFRKNLQYANLFLKALWLHRNRTAFQEVRKQTLGFFKLEKEALAAKLEAFKRFKHDTEREKKAQAAVHELTRRIKSTLLELSKLPVKGLFQDKNRNQEDLLGYLSYYKTETDKLCNLISQLHPTYQQLSKLQNQLFKKQEELVASKLEKTKNDLRIRITQMILENPDCQDKVDELKKGSEKVPEEIKDELGKLRALLLEAVHQFKSETEPTKLETIKNDDALFEKANKRHEINEVSKELVNFSQGLVAIEQEKAGEVDDLEYLKSQEENLERVALSKALPSTRILLKSKYIPLVDRKKKMLNRANQFLSEIISSEKAIRQALVSTFFQKRFGFHQFASGGYCIDYTSGAKDHTERNIYNAFILIAERFPKVMADASMPAMKTEMKKLEIKGIEGLRNLISQIWHGHADSRFLYLPSSLSLEEALDLCEYKLSICNNNLKAQRSHNSLILIYVHKIMYDAIGRDPNLKERYNQAILSNIFINVDGKQIFNNRESIFDACIRETFGKCHDKLADKAMQNFLFSS